MNNFWIPKTKSELVSWLKINRGWTLNRKTKSELYAIYFKERKNG